MALPILQNLLCLKRRLPKGTRVYLLAAAYVCLCLLSLSLSRLCLHVLCAYIMRYSFQIFVVQRKDIFFEQLIFLALDYFIATFQGRQQY